MSTVSTILSKKGSHVYSISQQATVLDAAKLMNEHRIGALVVSGEGDQADQVLGIFTERDVLRRVVAERRDPAQTTIADVMTRQVACISPDTPVEEARAIFRQRRIRHLPVVDDNGRLQGMVSIGDMNAHRLDADAIAIKHLHEYLYGQDDAGQKVYGL